MIRRKTITWCKNQNWLVLTKKWVPPNIALNYMKVFMQKNPQKHIEGNHYVISGSSHLMSIHEELVIFCASHVVGIYYVVPTSFSISTASKNILSTLLQLKMVGSIDEAENCNTNLKKTGEKKLEVTTIDKFRCPLEALNVHNKTQNVFGQVQKSSSHYKANLGWANGHPREKRSKQDFCSAYNYIFSHWQNMYHEVYPSIFWHNNLFNMAQKN